MRETDQEENKGECKAEHERARQVGVVHDVLVYPPERVEYRQALLEDM